MKEMIVHAFQQAYENFTRTCRVSAAILVMLIIIPDRTLAYVLKPLSGQSCELRSR